MTQAAGGSAARRVLLGTAALAALTAFASLPLWQNQAWETREGALVFFRAAEFSDLVWSGELWPRVAPNFYWGFGLPIFDFEPPLALWLAAAFGVFGLDVFAAIAAVGTATFAIAWLAGLRLLSLFTGSPAAVAAATVGALLPFRFAAAYVHGRPGEALGFALLPWAIAEAIAATRVPTRRAAARLGVALALTVLADPLAGAAAGLAAGISALAAARRRGRAGALAVLAGTAMAVVASAGYWLPAAVDRSLVRTELLTSAESSQGATLGDYPTPVQRLDPAFDFGRQDGAPYAAGGLLLAALLFALLRLGAASGRRRYGPWLLALAVCELLVAAGRTGLWDSLVPAMLASVPWQIHVVEGVLGMLICGLAIDEIFHRGLADLKLPSAIAAAAAVAGLGAAFALSDRAQTPWLEGSAAWGVLALGVLAGTLLALLLSGPARWVACAAVALAAPMLVATNGHARDAPLPRALLRSQALEGAAARVREGDGVHPMIVGGRSLAYVPRAVLEPPDSLRHNGVLRFEALGGRFSKRRGDGSVRRWTVENPIAQRIDLPIFAFPGWVLRVNGRDADLLEPGPNGRLAVELAEGPSELGVAFQGSPLHRGATWLSWIGGLALLAAWIAPDAQARGAPSSSSSEAGTR